MIKESRLLPTAAGVLVSLIFGFSFLFTKQSLNSMAPFELLGHRFSLAAIFLLLLIIFKRINVRFSPRILRDLLPLVIVQPIIYFLGEIYGVKLTSASESGLIISLIPVAVTFMGTIFLKEKVGIRHWMFVILSVCGVVLIFLAGSGYEFGLHFLGIASLLLAVIAAAVYNILARKFSRDYTPIEITVIMMIVGAIFFNIVRLLTIKPNERYFIAFLNMDSLIALLYLGILSSVGAFFLMNYMLKKLPAFQVATFVNLTTVVTVVAGVLFRGESFGVFHIIGGILILIAVWGINSFIVRVENK